MTPEVAIWIAIASGCFALLGSLGSQLVSALANLKAKSMDLVYARKADTYREFMEKAGAFAHDIKNEEKYGQFYHIYYATLIIASNKVADTFRGENSVILIADKINQHNGTSEALEELNALWQKRITVVANAMRDDLGRFSRH